MNLSRIFTLLFAGFVAVTITSCGGGGDASNDDAAKEAQKQKAKSKSDANILKVGDKLFNLPSPLETAFLIEEVGGHFSEDLLNPSVDATAYSTKTAQAMNLGIYGADLGYALIYDQSQKAFSLLATCKKLSGELGISPALYTSLMKRFEGNLDNRDSLLIMISQLNSLSDEYLKENEAEDVSALILYGGWVESLYFTTNLSKQLNNEKLRMRVGEQKNSLENLIGLIQQVNYSGDLDNVVTQLEELKVLFDKVEYSYEWAEPETKAEEKLTVIKSKSKVTLTNELLEQITKKVTEIRNSIIATTA